MVEANAKASLPVLVVGAGFAGVAAAFGAARSGVGVRIVTARAGSSELYSGILDGGRAEPAVVELARALGLELYAQPRAVATREGMVRRVRGRDAALLDLEAFAGKTIAVADVGRDDWDGELIARSLADSAWARETSTRFRCVHVNVLLRGAERRISAFDFALSLQEPARGDALGRALARAATDVQAFLLGPWLGVETSIVDRLSSAAGAPVGESASGPGGVSGARFAERRTTVLASVGVALERRALASIRPNGAALSARFADGTEVEARAVVLAVGGVASGAIGLAPSGSTPALRLGFDAPVRLALSGEIMDGVAWLSGPNFQRLGLGALEALGIAADEELVAAKGLPIFVCGDALAGQPRTALAALATGLDAGLRAANAR